MNFIAILLIVFMLTPLGKGLYSEVSEDMKKEIRSLILANEFSKAKVRIDSLRGINDEYSSDLELLNSELMIQKGEYLYRNEQYKTAYSYFLKASKMWRNNSHVNKRIDELKNRNLIDVDQTKSWNRDRPDIPDDQYIELSQRVKMVEEELFRNQLHLLILYGLISLQLAFVFYKGSGYLVRLWRNRRGMV